MSRIYLASSWRNQFHRETLERLLSWGHEVYNFKSAAAMPAGGPVATAFSWAEIDPEWQSWKPSRYRELLTTHPRAASGYLGDLRGMEWADTCVLLLPCGRSAHLEAGYLKGRGKRLIIYYIGDQREEPDLMYLLADNIAIGEQELCDALYADRGGPRNG